MMMYLQIYAYYSGLHQSLCFKKMTKTVISVQDDHGMVMNEYFYTLQQSQNRVMSNVPINNYIKVPFLVVNYYIRISHTSNL